MNFDRDLHMRVFRTKKVTEGFYIERDSFFGVDVQSIHMYFCELVHCTGEILLKYFKYFSNSFCRYTIIMSDAKKKFFIFVVFIS